MDRTTFLSAAEPLVRHASRRFAGFVARHSAEPDRAALLQAGTDALQASVESALVRLYLLEMHAARLQGKLDGGTPVEQLHRFVALARTPSFQSHLRRRYPVLQERLDTMLSGQCASMERLVWRLQADRDELQRHLGTGHGRLVSAKFGLGDPHRGGQTVARLVFSEGSVLYKPRSMRLDAVLDAFLERLFGKDTPARIRLPATIDRDGYGWAEFMPHTYGAGPGEQAAFYRNLGNWIAVLHLLGGTDIHHENLIACGPVPVVVDPECLFFEDVLEEEPSGRGLAYDEAERLIGRSILRTGIVPYRSAHLAFKGVDISAAGALPGQQPQARVPAIAGQGTADARFSEAMVTLPLAKNHPSPAPDPCRYREEIVAGFRQATDRLRALDLRDQLMPLLVSFEGCRVRKIHRPTQLYGDLMQMLWHPASLHDADSARERARDLLTRGGAFLPLDERDIESEIDQLCRRDIPVFEETVSRPGIASALAAWRASNIQLQELTLRGALLAVHLNQQLSEASRDAGPIRTRRRVQAGEVERERRRLARFAVERLIASALRGPDRTATWISPVLGAGGWAIRPLAGDLYAGLGGIAVALAGYLSEARHGRCEPVEGARELLEDAIRALTAMEDAEATMGAGGFLGRGAQIWTWLSLHAHAGGGQNLARAIERARLVVVPSEGEHVEFDVLDGLSGLAVPLLQLAERTGEPRWLALAADVGRRIEASAVLDHRGATWPSSTYDAPVGGLAHGVTGIGWALARLALTDAGDADDRSRWAALAKRAFDFEQSLYVPALAAWRDMRVQDERACTHAWCHGSVGIGLVAADLYARTGAGNHLETMRRAVASALASGWRQGHSLCHGSLGMRELIGRASTLDPGIVDEPPAVTDGRILAAIGENITGKASVAIEAFAPGIMAGLAGVVHGLNRMHPECSLGSPLLLEVA